MEAMRTATAALRSVTVFLVLELVSISRGVRDSNGRDKRFPDSKRFTRVYRS